MAINYSKRTLTHAKREAWVPKDLDEAFRLVVPNYQAWVINKIKEEIEKASE